MTDPEDALRDLAAASSGDIDPAPSPKPSPASGRPESPIAARSETPASKRPESPIRVTPEPDVSEQSANALAALSGTESKPYDPAAVSASRRRRMRAPDTSMMAFQTAAIPVLITVGLLMSAMGVWGILVKNGNDTLPMADQPNADKLAVLGLVALPIGVLFFASAGFFLWQVLKTKKKVAAYETMMEEAGR